jgi:hypothetical protein
MPEQRISAVLTPADLDTILESINIIKQKLPFLLTLTADERRALPKAGDKNRAFVLKALEVAVQNPTILPGIFSVEEMKKDVELGPPLQSILLAVARLEEMLNDTIAVVNGEAYSAALSVYNYARASGKDAALQGTVEELGKVFSKKARATAAKPTA